MKKSILFLALLFSVLCAKSQDTIVKRNGDKIIAKVLEIGPSEIKYKRFDFQDGPTYVEFKSNIDKINYSNGVKEIFTSSSPQTNQTNANTNEANRDYFKQPAYTDNHISQWGLQYRYHNDRISEPELFDMFNQTKDKKIMNLVSKAKDAKAGQFIGFLGIPLGVLSGFFFLKSTGLFYSSYNNSNRNQYGLNNNDLTVSGLCLAGAITCPIVSGVFKSNRNKYTREAIKLYNEKY